MRTLLVSIVCLSSALAHADGRFVEGAGTIGSGAVALGGTFTSDSPTGDTGFDALGSLDVGVIDRLQLGVSAGTQAVIMGDEELRRCSTPDGSPCGSRSSWKGWGVRARLTVLGDRESRLHLGLEGVGSYQHAAFTNGSHTAYRLGALVVADGRVGNALFYAHVGYARSSGWISSLAANELLAVVGLEYAVDLRWFSLNPRVEIAPSPAIPMGADALLSPTVLVGLTLVWKGPFG